MSAGTVGGGARGMAPTSRSLRFASTTARGPGAGVDRVATSGSLASGLPLIRLSESMTKRLLAPRVVHLGHRAPKDRATHQMRRSLACGKVLAMQAILRVAFADAEEPDMPQGAPGDLFRLIADLLDARQREVRHEGVGCVSLLPLIERENARQYAGDRHERRVCADEEDVGALQAMLDAHAVERTEMDRLDAAAREKLARLTLRASPESR